jgi:hypothetical protein
MSKTPLPDRLPGRVDEPIGNHLQTARPAHNTEVDSPPLTAPKSVSNRIGPRELTRLSRDLSERDQQILDAVNEHRFLTARQVERLVFTDHASEVTATRICRRVLQRLTEQRLLVRLARRVGGARAGSASYVYAVGPAGDRMLNDGHRRRWVREPTPVFLAHNLAVAETRIELTAAHRAGTIDLVSVDVEPACWRRYTGPGGSRETAKPDLYAVTSTSDFEHLWFLEIDLDTESLVAIARKCRVWDAYYRSGREQHRSGGFPLIVWVAPNPKRAARIERAIQATTRIEKSIFQVTTSEKLLDLIAGGTT